MRSNRVVTIALSAALLSSAAFATPVTYESAPASADTGVATAPYDEPGESSSGTSVLFDQSGVPLLWVSTPIYLRLPIFGAGAGDQPASGPGLSWVPGGTGPGPGSEGPPPGSEVPPGSETGPGDDLPGDEGPGDDQPREAPPIDQVPEPSTLMLLSPAVMLLLRRRRQPRA